MKLTMAFLLSLMVPACTHTQKQEMLQYWINAHGAGPAQEERVLNKLEQALDKKQ